MVQASSTPRQPDPDDVEAGGVELSSWNNRIFHTTTPSIRSATPMVEPSWRTGCCAVYHALAKRASTRLIHVARTGGKAPPAAAKVGFGCAGRVVHEPTPVRYREALQRGSEFVARRRQRIMEPAHPAVLRAACAAAPACATFTRSSCWRGPLRQHGWSVAMETALAGATTGPCAGCGATAPQYRRRSRTSWARAMAQRAG